MDSQDTLITSYIKKEMHKNDYCIVITTYADDKIGKKLIESLIEKRLAACVQVQNIKSYYPWEGKVKCTSEKLLLIKTKKSLYQEVEADIISNHNYKTPEILEVSIESGFLQYLDWIDKGCK